MYYQKQSLPKSGSILKAKDVIKILGISSATLERWIREDVLAPVIHFKRTRRWTQHQLDIFLANKDKLSKDIQ